MFRICSLFVAAGVLSAAAPKIQVVVVEGQGAINNARAHTGRDPVVEVRDEHDAPVSGATVTFQAPATGPSAVFGSGNSTYLTQTDSSGRAAARGLRPNTVKGPFQIRVTASMSGQMATASITQTNALPSESKSAKKVWVITLLAGAAAGGAVAATHGSKSSTAATAAASTAPSGTIVPGSPSFGPPH